MTALQRRASLALKTPYGLGFAEVAQHCIPNSAAAQREGKA